MFFDRAFRHGFKDGSAVKRRLEPLSTDLAVRANEVALGSALVLMMRLARGVCCFPPLDGQALRGGLAGLGGAV